MTSSLEVDMLRAAAGLLEESKSVRDQLVAVLLHEVAAEIDPWEDLSPVAEAAVEVARAVLGVDS